MNNLGREPLRRTVEHDMFVSIILFQPAEDHISKIDDLCEEILSGAVRLIDFMNSNSALVHINEAIEKYVVLLGKPIRDANPVPPPQGPRLEQHAKECASQVFAEANDILATRHHPPLTQEVISTIFIPVYIVLQRITLDGRDPFSRHVMNISTQGLLGILFPQTEDPVRYSQGAQYTNEVQRLLDEHVTEAKECHPPLYDNAVAAIARLYPGTASSSQPTAI